MISKVKLISIPVVSGRPTIGSYELPGLLFQVGLAEELKNEGVGLDAPMQISVPRLRGDPGPDQKAMFLRQVTETITQAYAGLSNTLEKEEFPVYLGGDCGLCLATMRETARVHDGLNLLWLDAHGDFNTPEITPSGYIGGMVLAAALGRGPKDLATISAVPPPVSEERTGLMAIRALDEAEEESLRESRARHQIFRKKGDLRSGVQGFLDETEGPVILHFDVDSVDPEDIPHVSFPAPGGPRAHEVKDSLLAVAKSGRLVALEVASLDATQKSAASSATLISKMLAETVAAVQ